MNKFYILIQNYLTKIKNLIKSIIRHSEVLFQRKKKIDNTYISIKQSKIREINNLQTQLKEVQLRTSALDKEVLALKVSIDKKINLIENLQDLITKRLD